LNNRLVTTIIIEALGRNGDQKADDLYKQVQKLHSDLEKRSLEESLIAQR